MRHFALLAIALLSACSPIMREEVAEEPVAAEQKVAGATDCVPDEDDGIGGTGCEVD
ncbi:hypothetical protein [Tabrizicola sp.]|uniref:hypothetical protein n=1 Tax=Tabrizicola sp. TaxID=2005166 RepID=UPI003F3DE73D